MMSWQFVCFLGFFNNSHFKYSFLGISRRWEAQMTHEGCAASDRYSRDYRVLAFFRVSIERNRTY